MASNNIRLSTLHAVDLQLLTDRQGGWPTDMTLSEKTDDPQGTNVAKRYVAEADLLEDAYRLGVDVFNSGFSPTFIIGLWRGGSGVGIAVQECLQHLGVETDHISVRTSYRGAGHYQHMVENAGSEIRVHGTQYLLETLNADDRLLIVDDVMSSGLNVEAVIDRLSRRLKRNMPEEIRVAVTWWKSERMQTNRPPDYFVNQTDDWLVMPYEMSGLTRQELLKHKPFLSDWLNPSIDDLS